MADEPEPQSVGTGDRPRGLGPHVVGQRVIVRRLLRGETGPSGGPAMTDLLGVCTSWGDDACVIEPESGGPVTIALADIVSGKPVPPRPSRFVRISAAAAESHVASLWPHLEQVRLGGWTLRSDPAPVGRPRRRANSCLAMGPAEVPFDEADAAIREFYAERDRPALAHVEAGSSLEREFREAGWEPLGDGDAHFEIASTAQVRRRLAGASPGGADVAETRPGHVRMSLDHVTGQATYADDWLALHDLVVEEAHRRRGHARAMLDELLDWGAEQGATAVWLHVETDNAPAIALYEELGFRVHHTARYLTPG